jgi:hypothetical protein
MINAERRNSLSLDQNSSAEVNGKLKSTEVNGKLKSTEVNGKLKSDKKSKNLSEVDAIVAHPYEPLDDERKIVKEEKIATDQSMKDQIVFSEYDEVEFSEMTPSEDIREEVNEGFNAIYTLMIAPSVIKSWFVNFQTF